MAIRENYNHDQAVITYEQTGCEEEKGMTSAESDAMPFHSYLRSQFAC